MSDRSSAIFRRTDALVDPVIAFMSPSTYDDSLAQAWWRFNIEPVAGGGFTITSADSAGLCRGGTMSTPTNLCP